MPYWRGVGVWEKVPRVALPQNPSARAMGTKSSDKIARSPTPPDTDDEGGDIEWPVHGIVGEDVDVFGISRSVVKQNKNGIKFNDSYLNQRPFAPVMRQARPC